MAYGHAAFLLPLNLETKMRFPPCFFIVLLWSGTSFAQAQKPTPDYSDLGAVPVQQSGTFDPDAYLQAQKPTPDYPDLGAVPVGSLQPARISRGESMNSLAEVLVFIGIEVFFVILAWESWRKCEAKFWRTFFRTTWMGIKIMFLTYAGVMVLCAGMMLAIHQPAEAGMSLMLIGATLVGIIPASLILSFLNVLWVWPLRRILRSPGPIPKAPKKFFLAVSNEVAGPYSLDEIEALVNLGTATAYAMCCPEGSQKWVPISTVMPSVFQIRPAT